MENQSDLLDEAYRAGDIVDGRAGVEPDTDGDGEAGGEVDGVVPESPYSGAVADATSAIVDEVARLERDQGRFRAWQLERIDEARRLAEATERGVLTVGSTLSAARRREMVRRSLVAELACALRLPEVTVTGMIADSEALMHRLPATMNALRAGDISYQHARVVVDQSASLGDDAALLLEEQALPFAKTVTVSTLRLKTRVLRERLDPGSIAARAARSAEDRRVEFQPADDGMAWLNLYTTAPEATSIYTAARDHALRLRTADDPRTLTQLTADVCTDALSAALSGDLPAAGTDVSRSGAAAGSGPGSGLGSGSAFRRIRPTVTVTVPALTLLGVSDEPATLDGYGPIDADTARALAGRSSTWYRMLTDPATGEPLVLESTGYRPTESMKRFLRYRDGTCRFPGCGRRAVHCDIDHTSAYRFGGPTGCDNLAHLCPKHHRLKHATSWAVEQRGAGTLEWTSPGGASYTTRPEVALPPPAPLKQSPPQPSDELPPF